MRSFKEMVIDESAQEILLQAALPQAAAPALAECAAMMQGALPPATMATMVGRPIVFSTGSSFATLYSEKGESEFKVKEGEPESYSKSLIIEADNPGDVMAKLRPLMEKNPIKMLPLLLSGKVRIRGSIRTAIRFRKIMKIARENSRRQRKELYGF